MGYLFLGDQNTPFPLEVQGARGRLGFTHTRKYLQLCGLHGTGGQDSQMSWGVSWSLLRVKLAHDGHSSPLRQQQQQQQQLNPACGLSEPGA